jgi:hypothetical protein
VVQSNVMLTIMADWCLSTGCRLRNKSVNMLNAAEVAGFGETI